MGMLITIYHRTPRGLRKVNEYYWWRVAQTKEMTDLERELSGDTPARMNCPGCGRSMTRQNIRYSHQCPGTLTDHPVRPGRIPSIPSTRTREQQLREYQQRNPNVTISDQELHPNYAKKIDSEQKKL